MQDDDGDTTLPAAIARLQSLNLDAVAAATEDPLLAFALDANRTGVSFGSDGASRPLLKQVIRLLVFVGLPLLIVGLGAYLFGDYGLGLLSWRESLVTILQKSTGVAACFQALAYVVSARFDSMRHSTIWVASGGVALVMSLLATTAIVDEYSEREQIRREELIQDHTWVSYDSPRYWPANQTDITGRPAGEPTRDEIQQELKLLRDAGFDGLFLHECRDGQVPVAEIARQLGFKAIVQGIGVSDSASLGDAETQRQIGNAIKVREVVDAYCLGSMSARSAELLAIKRELSRIRMATNRPAATLFVHDDFIGERGRRFRELDDFCFRSLKRSIRADGTTPEEAVAAVAEALETFRQDDKPSLLTDVFYPSAGGIGYTPQHQAEFFALVNSVRIPRGVNVVIFNSFDLPWKARLFRERDRLSYGVLEYDAHTGIYATAEEDGRLVFSAKQALETFRK